MLRVSLLGEQAITDDVTHSLRARSQRSIALVGYLALHTDRPQLRQRIAALFWPDTTDAQALTNLRRELHNLRQLLAGDPSLVVTPSTLCWHDTESCEVDVCTFETARGAALAAAAAEDPQAVLGHARAAFAAYRGPLLPGLYDEWVAEQRARLEQEYVDLCDLASGAGHHTGDLPAAMDAARQRIGLRPLEEVGYRRLMELQSAAGDRAGAISTYHWCASVLERELGIEPDRQTQQVFRGLLQSSGDRPAPVGPTARRTGIAARFIGRVDDVEALRSRWRETVTGTSGVVLVTGDAGVGKTRLLAQLAAEVRTETAAVGTARCFGIAGRVPFAPVIDWLRSPAIRRATAALDPIWRAEVERLVPTGPVRTATTGSRAKVDSWQRHRFFDGLARALTGCGRPLLLVLDNLQWCDQETLSVIGHCLARFPDEPVLVAATLRNHDEDLEHPVTEWIAQLRATGRLLEISLEPFAAGDTAALAEQVLDRPLPHDDVELLQAATGGYPLYVIEAVRAGTFKDADVRTPGELTAVLHRRLAQATPGAQEVAALAAALGRSFSLEVLVEASDLAAEDVGRAVDDLWRRRIIRSVGTGYDFSHDLLRDAMYRQVSPARRLLLHRRLAQALERMYADQADDLAARLAEQYQRAGAPTRAIPYYRRAAESAARTFAHSESIRLHGRARDLIGSLPPGRNRDLLELQVLQDLSPSINAAYGYSSPQLQEAAERCLRLAEHLDRNDDVLTSLITLWASRFVQARLTESHSIVVRALSRLAPTSPLDGQVHFAYAGSTLTLGRVAESLTHFEQTLQACTAAPSPSLIVGTRLESHAQAWSAHARWLTGDSAQALSDARAAIAFARRVEHPYSLAVAIAYGAITFHMCGQRPALVEAVQELTDLCERYGFAYYREWGRILEGWTRNDGSGLALARRGIKQLRTEGAMVRMPYWLSLLAELLMRDQQPEAARSTLDAALVDARSRQDLWWAPEVLRLRAAHDADEKAKARLRAGMTMAREQHSEALVRRCSDDLALREARPVTDGVR